MADDTNTNVQEEGVQAAEESIVTTPEAESAEKAAEVFEKAPALAEKKESQPKAGQTVADKAVSRDLEDIISKIEKLSVLELADLVHALEDRFGVTAAVPVGTGQAASGAPNGAAEPQEEKTSFNVILAAAGANKIGVIKAVRELVPTLGLKEAKDLVEAAPKPVMEGVNKATAEEAKTKLTAAGATAELQ